MLEECSTTLFLALQHPEQQIRLLAVKKVVAQLVNGDVDDEQFDEFIKDALLERLVDDSPQVVWHVFKVYDILLDKIEPEALFKQLSNIITSTSNLSPPPRMAVPGYVLTMSTLVRQARTSGLTSRPRPLRP
jgi:hypothetical protein